MTHKLNIILYNAVQELKWLKETAEDKQDYARIIGFEECLRQWKAAMKNKIVIDVGELPHGDVAEMLEESGDADYPEVTIPSSLLTYYEELHELLGGKLKALVGEEEQQK